MPGWLIAVAILVLLMGAALVLLKVAILPNAFAWSGEEQPSSQIVALWQLIEGQVRAKPETQPDVPVAYTGQNPFGANTFLEQEVEPAKRERIVQMLHDAGFQWIRQEFPWEDIEIHGKGDFEDRRNEPYRSAWDKYDQIVDLAGDHGLEIIARLSNPPEWSRAQGADAGTFAPPDNLDDYGDFVEAVASRYQGRIRYYQVWNEPNIYPEWGEQPVSPEAYTELLKVAYTRIKAACPECVVISGALAQTIPLGPRDLNDFIFLQRMYDAGAGSYFDVLAMQDYGLWSGPTDRRMRPRVLNFSRPEYLREIMVKNGDADKPIWITEMNWNAPPVDLPDKRFGFVTPEQQASNAVLAYQRIQQEWPWVGVANFWFFKRATDQEKDQSWYYFRMVEPDFTPLPVYDAMKAYTHSDKAQTLYPGVHQEDHWLLSYTGDWETHADAATAPGGVGDYRVTGDPQAGLSFAFEGGELLLRVGPDAAGTLRYSIDGAAEQSASFAPGEQIRLATGLDGRRHTIAIYPGDGLLSIDSLTVGK